MTEARAWLDARHPRPPASLRAAMARALDRSAAEPAGVLSSPARAAHGSPAGRLAGAALAALREVVGGEGGRASAADLLAADALLTYACEAAAEEGPAALEALTVALGPGHFEGLLEGARP